LGVGPYLENDKGYNKSMERPQPVEFRIQTIICWYIKAKLIKIYVLAHKDKIDCETLGHLVRGPESSKLV